MSSTPNSLNPSPLLGRGSPSKKKAVRQKRIEATPRIIRTLWTLEHGSKKDLERMREVPNFTDAIIYWATLRGWKVDHNPDSRRTERGFLDLWLVRRKDMRMMWRELKDENKRLTFEQKEMIEFLAAIGMDCGVWRPRDWKRIKEELE